MKRLILFNGTMGVGKTTVCRLLYRQLPCSVLLDGDWCWMMHPFTVNDETKAMVLGNIAHLLNSFLRCSCLQNILFCWVMDQQEILDDVLSRLDLTGCAVSVFTLTASPSALQARIRRDIDAGLRTEGDVQRSLERLPRYLDMESHQLDTSALTPEEAAAAILRQLHA